MKSSSEVVNSVINMTKLAKIWLSKIASTISAKGEEFSGEDMEPKH